VSAFLDRLKPAPYKPEITDKKVVEKNYSYWRIRVFYSMYLGYALYYLTRLSFTFAAPTLMTQFGLGIPQQGVLVSIFAITYGASKFISGVLADRSNPKYFMSLGLIATGIVNILFGLSSSFFFFCLLWGLNGWFQGFGWPACARLLTHWYSRSERGRWWSLWNTSHNIGGVVIPIITGFCAYYYGWRAAMILPGVVVVFGGLFLINRLTDTPQSLGLPSIEKHRSDYPDEKSKKEEERELSTREILFKYVLTNPYIWLLGVSYFFVYIVRNAVNHWTVIYLVEQKAYNVVSAAAILAWFEIGGIAGSLFAGWSSDKIFKGNRGPINVLYCLFSTAAIALFWLVSGTTVLLDSVMIFTIGFLIFGPQMLIGVAAVELSHKKAAGTATGLTGWIAYLGVATSGYPLGKIIEGFGWEGYFIALSTCGLISTALLLPLWNAKEAKEKTVAKETIS